MDGLEYFCVLLLLLPFIFGSQLMKKPPICVSVKLSSDSFVRSHLSSWLPFHGLPGRQPFPTPTFTRSHHLSLGPSRLSSGFRAAFSAAPLRDPEGSQPAASAATRVCGTSHAEVKTLTLGFETLFFFPSVHCFLLLLPTRAVVSGFHFLHGAQKRSSLALSAPVEKIRGSPWHLLQK